MLRLCLIGLYSSVFVLSVACAPTPAPVIGLESQPPQPPVVLADASAIEHMLQGERLFLKKDYLQAADHFRLALVHDPYSVHLHLRLAKALGRANAWLAALQVLEKAQVACSGHPKVRLALGELYLDTADYDAVESLLEPAGLDSEDYLRSLLMRMDAALWAGNLALTQAIEANALKEFPDISCSLGALLEDHGEDRQALLHYGRCPAQNTEAKSRLGFRLSGIALLTDFKTVTIDRKMNLEPPASVPRAEELRRRGVELRRAHRLSPGDCHTLYRLGLWYKDKNDEARSLRYLEEAYGRCTDHPVIAITLAWAYWSVGKSAQARVLAERVLESGHGEDFVDAAKAIIERSDSVQAKQ